MCQIINELVTTLDMYVKFLLFLAMAHVFQMSIDKTYM